MRALKQITVLVVAGLLSSPVLAGELSGRLQWAERATLSTPVSGVVAATPLAPGERVGKGQVVLRLDDRGFRAAVQRSEAQLARMSQARDEAQREYERSKELYDRTLLSEHDLQLAQIADSAAQADFAAAQAALTEARLNLEYSALRAPFAGVILQCHTHVGETIVTRLSATPLIEMAATDPMSVQVAATIEQLRALQPGRQVQVTVAGTAFTGTVQGAALEPLTDDAEHYAVDIRFALKGQTLRAGQAATVSWE